MTDILGPFADIAMTQGAGQWISLAMNLIISTIIGGIVIHEPLAIGSEGTVDPGLLVERVDTLHRGAVMCHYHSSIVRVCLRQGLVQIRHVILEQSDRIGSKDLVSPFPDAVVVIQTLLDSKHGLGVLVIHVAPQSRTDEVNAFDHYAIVV